jgi:hypothetical protein
MRASETHRLLKRGAAWRFRRRVSKHLQAAIGKAVVQESLHTTSKKKAIKAWEILAVKWSERFERLEATARRRRTARMGTGV